MSRRLKLLLSISCLFILNICYSQLDSISFKKKHSWLHLDVGLPLYNKLNISYSLTFKDFYWVNSKIKPLFNLGYSFTRKNLTLGFSASYIQNEFEGKSFVVSEKDKFGNYNYKFNVYQRVKYNFSQVNFSIGYNKWIGKRHNIGVNAEIFFSCFYNIRLSNYYSNEQYGFDTTGYNLARGVNTTKSYNLALPRAGFSFNYSYVLSSRFGVNFSLVNYYLFINDFSGVGSTVFENNTYYFDAYDVNKHILFYAKLGLKYRLK